MAKQKMRNTTPAGAKKHVSGFIDPNSGLIFWAMSGRREIWVTPEKYEIYRENARASKRRAMELRGDDILEKARSYYWRNRDRAISVKRKYREENPDSLKEQRKRHRAKLNPCPIKKLIHALACGVRSGLKKRGYRKSSPTLDIIGCSFDFLRDHLQARFLPGMTWDNWGRHNPQGPPTWQVDHIIALASAKDEKTILLLWHHSNLRPLWSGDNNAKSDFLPCGRRARDVKKLPSGVSTS